MKVSDLVQKAKTLARNLRPAPPAERTDPAQIFAGETPRREWTVLVYMDGRDGRAHQADSAFNRLEQVGSTGRAHVVAQVSQQPTLSERFLPNMQELPTRRYYVRRDQQLDKVASPVLEEASQPPSLAEFVRWGVEKFPSRRVAVLVQGKVPAAEIEAALEGRKVDVLGLDGSCTQRIDDAYRLRHHADVLTGSEDDGKRSAYPYGNAMFTLHNLPDAADAREVGSRLVQTYSQRVGSGMQSALDLGSLDSLAGSMRGLVETILAEKAPRDVVYTAMQSGAPMDRSDTLAEPFELRDLGGFLGRLRDDSRLSEPVRKAAQAAFDSYQNSVVARFASSDKEELRAPTGATAYFPSALSSEHQETAWERDSGWGRLLDYALDPAQDRHPATRLDTTGLGLGQAFGKWGLFQYKKYVSPYLNSSCAYTPSCSQFAREAVETYGLWKGGTMGALRFFSCTGQLSGADPVPGAQPHDHGAGSPPNGALPRGGILVSPPQASTATDRALVRAARVTGQMLGGLGLGALVAPIGAVVGGYVGWKAGRGTLDEHLQAMSKDSNASVVQGFRNISDPLSKGVQAVAGSLAGTLAGGVVGAVSGALMGLVGGAYQGGRWGKLFGGLYLENRVKDALGELPPDPATEAILEHDYGQN